MTETAEVDTRNRDPLKHTSFLYLVILSSVLHGGTDVRFGSLAEFCDAEAMSALLQKRTFRSVTGMFVKGQKQTSQNVLFLLKGRPRALRAR